VQQGAELSVFGSADPSSPAFGANTWVEAGKTNPLKACVKLFAKTLDTLADGTNSTSRNLGRAGNYSSALENIVPPGKNSRTKF